MIEPMTVLVAVPEDNDQPISKEGINDLVCHGLAIAGHAATLRYLSEQLQIIFDSPGNPGLAPHHARQAVIHEVEQIVGLLEFTCMEIEDVGGNAQILVSGWGNCQRRKKLGPPTDA